MHTDPATRPDSVAAAVSREIVAVLKESAGRGPTKAKTYLHDDCVVLLLREGHTRTEATMFDGGGMRSVAQARVDFSETIRGPLTEVIEHHVGRKVAGFLSSSQQHPDLISFVFVLESSPLLELDPCRPVRFQPPPGLRPRRTSSGSLRRRGRPTARWAPRSGRAGVPNSARPAAARRR